MQGLLRPRLSKTHKTVNTSPRMPKMPEPTIDLPTTDPPQRHAFQSREDYSTPSFSGLPATPALGRARFAGRQNKRRNAARAFQVCALPTHAIQVRARHAGPGPTKGAKENWSREKPPARLPAPEDRRARTTRAPNKDGSEADRHEVAAASARAALPARRPPPVVGGGLLLTSAAPMAAEAASCASAPAAGQP